MNTTRKTVIVTDASSGIGYALIEAYLKRGYNVVGNARTAGDRCQVWQSQKVWQVAGDQYVYLRK